MQFLDLPLELVAAILFHLGRPQYLAVACRVNKAFFTFTIPRLYERASIYSWHKHAKAKVVSLFDTLSLCPQLAKYVLRLEIRDFPKSAGRADTDAAVLEGLKNCVNLEACIWTRDGALTSDILSVLQASDTLVELEINGHSDGKYDAGILSGFSHLRRLSLIMPSTDVVRQLPSWIAVTGASLRSLTLICKMSPLVTDAVLERLAPSLAHLEQLSIIGCLRVSHVGVWALLVQNNAGLQSLALEGLPPKFNLAALAALCTDRSVLARLVSLTVTVHTESWLASVSALITYAPLERFQLYATRAFEQTPATDAFWGALIDAHGPRLTRVSVHRMPVALHAIADLCAPARCPALIALFVVIDPADLAPLADCLATARALATVHVNFHARAPGPEADAESDVPDHDAPRLGVLTAPEALAIVRRCPETIALFGCNARVWQVGRHIRRTADGALVAERFLAKYDSPDVPEQFLVVRT
ncbi:hypothetical protein B0H15DRAFT_841137 [Mycena belliarum]|uniref:F-box domain-containing protein n=1 Tax=Mycena belliarum TaxID=1033014 RepID=A0AAD6U2K1_9AGAR|nr:hypothetical protein B0H15DRAFT_841137 [Mycena belliae]